MKNIFLGLIFLSVFFPQGAFAAPNLSPQAIACNQQLDEGMKAFWEKQGQELNDFTKANPESMSRHDKHFHGLLEYRDAERKGNASSVPTPPDEDPAFAAYQEKSQGEKASYLAKYYQGQKDCSNL